MKKKIALILAMAMALGGVSSSNVFAEDAYAMGDANMNGKVDASDAAAVLIAAAQIGAGGESDLTAAQEVLADINKDGKVDASDAAAILILAARIGAGEDVALEYVSVSELPADSHPAALSWTKLHDIQNAKDLREILNTYTNPNDTLLTAYQNADFVNALSDTNTLNTLSSSLSYTDLDDSNSYEAVLNVYFDLLPDTSTSASEFNGDVSLTRGQAMTLITRATIEVPESGIPTSSESFTSKVGTSPYTDYASYQDGNAYISSKQGLDSENFNAPMSTAEYIYMTVNAVYGGVSTANIKTDGMAFKDGGLFEDKITNAEKISSFISNPDSGLPTALYNAVCIAYSNGAITNNTNLDDSISKTEAINILDAIVNAKVSQDKELQRINQEMIAGNSYEVNKDSLSCDKETYIKEYIALADTGLSREEIESQLLEKFKSEDTTNTTEDTTEDTTPSTQAPSENQSQQQQPVDNTPTPTEAPKQETPAPTEAPKQETPAPTEAPPQIAPQQPETNPPADTGNQGGGGSGMRGGGRDDDIGEWDGNDPFGD